MTGQRIVVVGAGPGGLAAAMLLARRGAQVTIVERRPRVGGRTSTLRLGAVAAAACFYHGVCLEDGEDAEAATDAYEQSLKLAPQSTHAAEARQRLAALKKRSR